MQRIKTGHRIECPVFQGQFFQAPFEQADGGRQRLTCLFQHGGADIEPGQFQAVGASNKLGEQSARAAGSIEDSFARTRDQCIQAMPAGDRQVMQPAALVAIRQRRVFTVQGFVRRLLVS